MRAQVPVAVLLGVLLFSTAAGQHVPRSPVGLRKGQKEINKPLDPPLELPRAAPDSAKLKSEAEELAQLSSGIPARISLVKQGKLPKDLSDQLKQIEKLAKHLRSQLSP